uniref:Uncharacterized protein n=1 Tax=Knipowitschia caucasica TaxID=637954 RepID=A0AAV2LSJ5_KNICA
MAVWYSYSVAPWSFASLTSSHLHHHHHHHHRHPSLDKVSDCVEGVQRLFSNSLMMREKSNKGKMPARKCDMCRVIQGAVLGPWHHVENHGEKKAGCWRKVVT